MTDLLQTLLISASGADGVGEETLLGLDATGWVYVGVSIFFILAFAVGKVHTKIAEGLDAQIAQKSKALAEAEAIRTEAELLLANAQKQLDASTNDAKEIIAQAQGEAEVLLSNAEAEAKAIVETRQKMASDKIAAAERNALADVRTKAAEAAISAATLIIAENHDNSADKSLIDHAIGDIGAKSH